MARGKGIRALIITAALAAPAAAHAQTEPDPGGADRERALQCLTLAIVYEAGFESAEGQQAVAEVIVNRTRHPAYPNTVCGVVFQGSARRTGCQFTFTCDGSLRRRQPARVHLAAREVARQALSGEWTPRVGGATHYHANYVSPYWAPSLIRVGRIGAHIFYRAPGALDLPARYTARPEPSVAGLGDWLTATDPITQGRKPAGPPPAAPPPAAQPQFAPWGLAQRESLSPPG